MMVAKGEVKPQRSCGSSGRLRPSFPCDFGGDAPKSSCFRSRFIPPTGVHDPPGLAAAAAPGGLQRRHDDNSSENRFDIAISYGSTAAIGPGFVRMRPRFLSRMTTSTSCEQRYRERLRMPKFWSLARNHGGMGQAGDNDARKTETAIEFAYLLPTCSFAPFDKVVRSNRERSRNLRLSNWAPALSR
jgi:hypothetical protein